jgi:hypothetical protein
MLIREKLSQTQTSSGSAAPGVKVFWFFFSKKNTSSFSEEKEAKRLLFLALRSETCKLDGRSLAGKMRHFNALPGRGWGE